MSLRIIEVLLCSRVHTLHGNHKKPQPLGALPPPFLGKTTKKMCLFFTNNKVVGIYCQYEILLEMHRIFH